VPHYPVVLHVFYIPSFPQPLDDSIELSTINWVFRAQHVRPTGHRADMHQRGAGVTADLVQKMRLRRIQARITKLDDDLRCTELSDG